MKTKDVKDAIEKLGPWAQRFKMGNCYSSEDERLSGESDWKIIRSSMYEDSIEGYRILELGSLSGYHSVKLALEGADVIAVEPYYDFVRQSKWTKYFFEYENGLNNLNIQFKNCDISEIFEWEELGKFDYAILNLVLQRVDNIVKQVIIEKLCKITERIIIRTPQHKPRNAIGFYNSVLLNNGFYLLKRKNGEKITLVYGKPDKLNRDII